MKRLPALALLSLFAFLGGVALMELAARIVSEPPRYHARLLEYDERLVVIIRDCPRVSEDPERFDLVRCPSFETDDMSPHATEDMSSSAAEDMSKTRL